MAGGMNPHRRILRGGPWSSEAPRSLPRTRLRSTNFASSRRDAARASRRVKGLLRKFASGSNALFEHNLVTAMFQALDVVAGQTFRFETVKEIAA